MSKFCGECGTKLNDDIKFCTKCGKNQNESEQSVSEATPIPQAQPAEQPAAQEQAQPVAQTIEQPVVQPAEQPAVQEQAQPVVQPVVQPAEQTVTQIKQEVQPQTGQPDASAPVVTQTKIKSKKPLFIAIAGILAIAIAAGLYFFVIGVTNEISKTAKADYYELGKDKIPSVKLALGEERKVTKVGTETKNDVTTKSIYYETSGTVQNMEMYAYCTYLISNDGFITLETFDFNGSSGNGLIGRDSVDDGYVVLVRMEYDTSGYTITIEKRKDTITIHDPTNAYTDPTNPYIDPTDDPDPEITTKSRNTNDKSAAGLWRNESENGVILFYLKTNGTFSLLAYPADRTEEDVTMTGNYSASDGEIMLFNIVSNSDEDTPEEVTISYEINGDTMVADGDLFDKVPESDIKAVLADPLAPYPPE